ncbi:STE3-like pheromone receptor [Armillaria solidipes]|uniref:STE3-like pheromone receptor n=1 Tax=Armillaria solidipes TaxID=1076256 RepID=A0A2H3BZ30_9AGAR|nr:STE3-like pheromone receptor [Armillaria solidipes]
MDPRYPLFSIFAFLGFIISLIPLPWHLQAWNSGTCAFMLWTSTICLVMFINSIVWADNVDNVAPVWCDISAQIILGASVGIPASVLCISRRLYTITAVQTASVTRADKRRAVIIDLCIALGLPILVLVLHTVVHAHRFDILEDIGCYPVTYNTLPSYFLFYMWPILIGIVSFIYSGLTLRAFFVRRVQFQSLISTASALSVNRYLRLMILSLADMFCTIPLAIYTMYIGAKGVPLAPWISWEDTHYDFGRVGRIPALIWRTDRSYDITVELHRWIFVFCAFIFFALFGFASEAKKHYRMAFWAVAKRFGFKPKVQSPKMSLPRYFSPVGYFFPFAHGLLSAGTNLQASKPPLILLFPRILVRAARSRFLPNGLPLHMTSTSS